MGDSLSKDGLIPHVEGSQKAPYLKLEMALKEGFISYQLVGEVMAHQGEDG